MNTDVPTDQPSEPLGVVWSGFIVAIVLATWFAGVMGWFGVACTGDAGLGWALIAVFAWFIGLHPMALVLLGGVTVGTLALRALSRAWHRGLKVMLLMLVLPPASAALCAGVAKLVQAQARCSLGF